MFSSTQPVQRLRPPSQTQQNIVVLWSREFCSCCCMCLVVHCQTRELITSSLNGSPEQPFRGNALALWSRLPWVSCRPLSALLLGTTQNSGKMRGWFVKAWFYGNNALKQEFHLLCIHEPSQAWSDFASCSDNTLKTHVGQIMAPPCSLRRRYHSFYLARWLWIENLRDQPCPRNMMAFCWLICWLIF